MKVIFMGTPDFAVPCLEALYKCKFKYEIISVFTQPDKAKGRGYVLTAPPVKQLALKYNIPVYQPASLKTNEVFDLITSLNPDIIIVVAYGKILPVNILNIPKMGCVNVHGSLLPKYRGSAPIQWSVINGEKTTGITTMFMDAGMDTGDILLKSEVTIGNNETSGELYDRLKIIGADLLLKTLEKINDNSIVRTKQDNSLATYAPMLNKTMSLIDWNKNSHEIHNLVRGLNPWPIASTKLNNKTLKIYKTRISENISGNPGEVKSLNPFIVCCSENTSIEILEVQLESKKRMSSADFVRGYKDKKLFLD